MSKAPAVLACRNLCKTYYQGKVAVPVLLGVNLTIGKGERVAIVGASGSGKSTLLHLLGGLDSATSGQAFINGRDMQSLNETERGELRNKSLGFVYQFHHLLPEFNAIENVAMPLIIRRLPDEESSALAIEMLQKVGLGHRLNHVPSELSGGERQRVALARALVTKPACILADEPTGNLDTANSDAVLKMLRSSTQQFKQTVLMITHNPEAAAIGDRILHMRDGRMLDE
jgi:lipoprotein-releasing system ATP-binding protein